VQVKTWCGRLAANRALKIVLAVYVTAVALLPFAHHDLACHLKSSTHCTSCVVGSSGEAAQSTTGTAGAGLTACGQPPRSSSLVHDALAHGVVAGRSPPARG
jgi:hypothetical protein